MNEPVKEQRERSVAHGPMTSVTIDCDHCLARGPSACGDCLVAVLLGGPPQGVLVDSEERAALDTLAENGLVPPLRLVTAVDDPRPVDPL